MEKDKQLIVNAFQTPDGTIIESRHRHDYVTHLDKNGLEYMTDGGTDYVRCSVNPTSPAKSLCVYEDDDFELIRTSFKRGSRGINGDEPLTYVPLSEMNDNWLQATIDYIGDERVGNYNIPLCLNPNNVIAHLYVREQKYRKANNIIINE